MEPFIDDRVGSLGTGDTRLAGFVLDEVKVSRDQITSLVRKLRASVLTANYTADKAQAGSLITAETFQSNFDRAALFMDQLYGAMNYLDVLNNSYMNVLFSDIKALEKELNSLDKSVENYAFLLADGKAFDFAYLEPFDDLRNMDTFKFAIPDRANQYFSQAETASVDLDQGMLMLMAPVEQTAPISNNPLHSIDAQGDLEGPLPITPSPHLFPVANATVMANNAGALITTDTGVSEMIYPTPETGWKLVAKSPQIIKNPLAEFKQIPDFDQDPYGMQLVVDLNLPSVAPCDFLNIRDLSFSDFEIVQIYAYPEKNNDQVYKLLLKTPVTIKGTMNINFPNQPVAKFRLFLRKRQYQRGPDIGISSEKKHRRLWEEIEDRPSAISDRDKLIGALLNYAALINKAKSNPWSIGFPSTDFQTSWGSLSAPASVLENARRVDSPFTNNTAASSLFREVVTTLMDSTIVQSTLSNNPSGMILPSPSGGIVFGAVNPDIEHLPPVMPSPPEVAQPGLVSPSTGSYYIYSLCIYSIKVGTSAQRSKAVYVSKPLSANGDVGQVKIKVSDTNYYIPGSPRDSDQLTSVEYSVSNLSSPSKEEDWIPIVPVGQTSVTGERLFFNPTGRAVFRFPASATDNVTIYKNGYKISFPSEEVLERVQGRTYYDQIRMPLGSFSSTDIFTVDYTPAGDFSLVDFSSTFANQPLMTSFDSQGAGEFFTGTTGTLQISLAHHPYVDYEQIASSTYSSTIGYSPYNPVSIRFSDNTRAINLTDYSRATQPTLDAEADEVQFIQSGNLIIFNKSITQSFRVFYTFLPSNLRIRTVLRCNHVDFVSPLVDYVQVKGKTRKSDLKQL